jgi:hypothetical protein
MPSVKMSVAVLATALFASLTVRSQIVYQIDPNSVPLSTRQGWCQAQIATCPYLCTQITNSTTTSANDCNAEVLTYDCVCDNGLSPNASEYSQTLPYFICTQYGTQCVANCGSDTACQSACRADHPCGAQNPTLVNTSTIAPTASPTGTGTQGAATATGSTPVTYNGIAGATETSTSAKKSGADAALNIGRSYGLGIVFASLFAGFALVM